ncbi:hypothetical protein NQZ68_033865 [Dissostichus eleginoides]|nr:hypothetical protein NQZ68_033865 [Dissostichus eleginoides]
MKKVVAENKPHLCLFALRDINPGEEITYDYGGTDWPWRKQVGEQSTATESSEAEIPSTRLFNKKLLWRHMKICKFKPNVPQKPGKTRVQALSAFAVPPPPGVKIEFWKLLNNMVQDDVYIAAKSDVCIMEYGEHLYHRLGYDVGKHEYIRQKLTELGRLLEDVTIALSELEKKLCKYFRRIEIRGKRGRRFPVLLTPAMQQALDLLVGTRQECGVPKENIYLFARPSAFTCYRGSDCLRYFAKAFGAKNPESLTSTKLRKQTGTLSQVLNLTNTELDLLADFLGHDIRVHRQFYRLPEGTLQLAKISKLLMALEQGRLAELQGKTLDDISIDPEENVRMDSDNETVCESDSQGQPNGPFDTC